MQFQPQLFQQINYNIKEDILNRLPVAVIPAYKPLPVVINIAKELLNSKSFQGIVCVNDGSGKEFDNIFAELKTLGVIVEIGRAHV